MIYGKLKRTQYDIKRKIGILRHAVKERSRAKKKTGKHSLGLGPVLIQTLTGKCDLGQSDTYLRATRSPGSYSHT